MAKAKAAERVATEPVILSPSVHGFFAAMDGATMSFQQEKTYLFSHSLFFYFSFLRMINIFNTYTRRWEKVLKKLIVVYI